MTKCAIKNCYNHLSENKFVGPVCLSCYVTPPKRPWVGLTKKEQLEIFRQLIINPVSEYKIFKAYEKALKEKNT